MHHDSIAKYGMYMNLPSFKVNWKLARLETLHCAQNMEYIPYALFCKGVWNIGEKSVSN